MKLSKDLSELLESYKYAGLINDDSVFKIIRSNCQTKAFLSIVRSIFDMGLDIKMRLWYHIISEWDDSDKDKCLDERESIFLRYLIENKGCVFKKDITKTIKLLPEGSTDRVSTNLQDQGLVLIMKLDSNEVVYVINHQYGFFKEVRR